MNPLTEDNRTMRKRVLDTWMRNLPQDVRDAMALFGMSDDEYRRRIEQQLFGPLIEATSGTTPVVISPIHQPLTWQPWSADTTQGTVTTTTPWIVLNTTAAANTLPVANLRMRTIK